MAQPIISPPNPYVGTLRIFPGTLVTVSGRPRPGAKRFAINYQTGPSLNPRDDLALHLSPCFDPPVIIRNSLRQNSWGLEESWGAPANLYPQQPFEIIILAEPEQFKIAINGVHYCEFKHRFPYHEITHLTIDGDVDIDRIAITSGPDNAPRHQPSAPPLQPSGPYPTGMPMPPLYPGLPAGQPAMPQPYGAGGYGQPAMPHAPPTAYGGPYPPQPAGPYPSHMPAQPSSYPQAAPMGPPGYPPQQGPYPQQPGHSSGSSPFGQLPIGGKALGTIAGLGLAGAAGAAVLSAAGSGVKKIFKPKKLFKHKGFKHGSSSSSSGSSRSSFSSRSSDSS